MLSEMFRQEEVDLGELETGVLQLEADNAALHKDIVQWRRLRGHLKAKNATLQRQMEELRELQAELEPKALRLEPEVVMYKATPNLVPHAEALERFLTIMRGLNG